MTTPNPADNIGARVARHRKKVTASGARRVEVTVPKDDAALIKSMADALRSGGQRAEMIRETLSPIVGPAKAQTGDELVAFLRASPLVQGDLDIERDRSTGRSADFS